MTTKFMKIFLIAVIIAKRKTKAQYARSVSWVSSFSLQLSEFYHHFLGAKSWIRMPTLG